MIGKLFDFITSKGLSLLGALKGWQGLLAAFLIGSAVGGAGVWRVMSWQDAAAAGDRAETWARGVQIINAANEAQAAIKAADAQRALEAVEAAAQAERERADSLAQQLEAIRAIPEAENCALGLETMKILEGLM